MFDISVQRHCRAEAGQLECAFQLFISMFTSESYWNPHYGDYEDVKRSTRTGPNLEDTVAKRGTGDPCVAVSSFTRFKE